MRFEWDPDKRKQNAIKHGVTFKEAESVFDDENAITLEDIGHSINEERFIIIGMSIYPREITVCHCYRNDDIIRIVSARKATKKEIQLYEEGLM
ncbi:MAG: BrnT family toxin [Defluviitaleaceae bacterium]|nr:BrnT family toxin [Defluviitaleaceae bacterium]